MRRRGSVLRLLAVLAATAWPAFAAAQGPAPARVVYDRAHGENEPVPEMAPIAARLGFDLEVTSTPLTSAALAGARLLYLRAPSVAIAAEERAAIVAFVRGGGSLLLVMDENRRQDMSVVRANDVIEPFGLRLAGDTEYLHNCGAVAKAGEIHAADREVPYSGARARYVRTVSRR